MTILEEIAQELARARLKHPRGFHSEHEGWAVLFEEVDELWDEVRKQRNDQSEVHMRRECIQVAAMAVRFIEDCGL